LRTSRPISSPADVVTGRFGRSRVAMTFAISAMATWGRKVIGPGAGSNVAVPAELVGAKEPHDESPLIDHDAGVPPSGPNAFLNVSEGFLGMAGRYLSARDRRGSRSAGIRAFGRGPVRHPVRLARRVRVHLAEPEAFEPPRGSCAQVSGRVPAVDDHRALGSQARPDPGAIFRSGMWIAPGRCCSSNSS
jgi:hypothetical protein